MAFYSKKRKRIKTLPFSCEYSQPPFRFRYFKKEKRLTNALRAYVNHKKSLSGLLDKKVY